MKIWDSNENVCVISCEIGLQVILQSWRQLQIISSRFVTFCQWFVTSCQICYILPMICFILPYLLHFANDLLRVISPMIGSNGAFHHSDQNKWKWIRITLGRKFFFFFRAQVAKVNVCNLVRKLGRMLKSESTADKGSFELWCLRSVDMWKYNLFSQVQIELQTQVQAQVQTQLQIQRRLRGVDVWKCNSFVSSTISPPSPLLLCPRRIVMTRHALNYNGTI